MKFTVLRFLSSLSDRSDSHVFSPFFLFLAHSVVLLSLASCTLFQNQGLLSQGRDRRSGDGGSSLSGLGADAAILGCSDVLPTVLKAGDTVARRAVFNLNRCQRRAMVVLSEGASIPSSAEKTHEVGQSLFKTTLKYVKVRREKVRVLAKEFDGQKWQVIKEAGARKKILDDALVYVKHEYVFIPVHQETASYHPLLQQLLSAGDAWAVLPSSLPAEMSRVSTLSTMSRSQWVLPKDSDSLYTIKMGSDVVHGKKQPHKLLDVYGDLWDLEDIARKTSIAALVRSQGITYIPDRYGVFIDLVDTRQGGLPPYSIALRDYDSVLRDQDRVYISLHRLLLAASDALGGVEVPIQKHRKIVYANEDFQTILLQLNDAMAKAVAIHNANGYLTADFHGQNIMVGLPLAKHVRAQLVIRDVTDIYDTDFTPTLNCYPCLKQIKAERWPSKTTQAIDEVYTLAYAAMMLKLNFMGAKAPWGQVTRHVSPQNMWHSFVEPQQDAYWQDVTRVRQQYRCLP